VSFGVSRVRINELRVSSCAVFYLPDSDTESMKICILSATIVFDDDSALAERYYSVRPSKFVYNTDGSP